MAATWILSREQQQCSACGSPIPEGSRVFPQEDSSGQLIQVHLRCALAAAAAAGLPLPEPPVCRDWQAGCCPFRDTCILRHPPAAAEGRLAAAAAASAAAAAHVAARRRGKVLKKFRAGVFRRWLLETYGADVLRKGAGVLDVAGGRGELAFELLNLSAVPATVLEPRPLDLRQRAELLTSGFYSWRGGLLAHLNQPWPAGAGLQTQQPVVHSEPAPGANNRSSCDRLVAPQQLRMVVTSELAACLTEALASSSGAGRGGDGDRGSSSDGAGRFAGPEMPACWPALFQAARQEARDSRWAAPSSGHGPGSNAQPGQAAAGQGDGAVPVGPAEQQVAGDGVCIEGGRACRAAEGGPSGFLPSPWEVTDAEEAWHCLAGFSVVVGMHPDEATDFIVDLALAANKPFAVVPCCIHADVFPGRRLDGRPVASYEDLVAYLVAKDPRSIKVATLPVEGRSRVLYRLR